MKKILRDVVVIAVLLGAIVAAPFVIDAMKSSETEKKAEAPASVAEDKPAEKTGAKPEEKPKAEASTSITPIVPDKDCPDINLGAGKGEAASTGFDGGGGRDTLKTSGDVALDGKSFSGIEVIDVRDGAANRVTVRGSGLTSLKGHHAYVIGDKDIDTILLDPCLRWNDPISIFDDGPETLLRFDVYDNHGNVAYLSVTEGMKIEKASRQ
jgi:hypothetical protein